VLDPGGFAELTLRGRWDNTPGVCAAAVRLDRDDISGLD
jgi:hypothetical protein